MGGALTCLPPPPSLQSGASLHMKDYDGCTPLALLSEDRKYFKSDPSEPWTCLKQRDVGIADRQKQGNKEDSIKQFSTQLHPTYL